MNKQLCTYDGITALNMDPVSINYVLSEVKKYKLRASFDLESKIELGQSGRFRNFDLTTGANSRGSGIYLGGSLHKWKNGNHNHDQFYWHEFNQVVEELVDEFKLRPAQVDVCGLEAGINFNIPVDWNYQARTFAKNILFINGKPREEYITRYDNGGIGYEASRGECAYKGYDKGRQYKTGSEILRLEKVYAKGRPLNKLGIRTLEDLLKPENHGLICNDVLKSFKGLMVFQPELLNNPLLSNEDYKFAVKFSTSDAWQKQLKENRNTFKNYRARYNSLINKYCDYNIQEEVLKAMASMLQ